MKNLAFFVSSIENLEFYWRISSFKKSFWFNDEIWSILSCLYGFYWYISIVLCVVPSLCAGTFEYEDMHPQYTIGQKITENKPVGLGEGSYTISSKLPKGLNLDPRTGVISGTAEVGWYDRHVITYNSGKEDEASCTLIIMCIISNFIFLRYCFSRN